MTDTPATPSVPTEAWHNGVSPELLGALQTRGWDRLTPDEAARTIAKSYRELELFRGVPAERLVKLPENLNDPEAMRPILTRLGVPETADGYKFEGVKADEGVVKVIGAKAHELGLLPDQARAVAETVSTIVDQIVGERKTEVATSAADNEAALASMWGNAKDQNLLVARNAAAAAGVTPEQLDAAQKSMGFAAVMKMFHAIGVKTGEDKFIVGGSTNNGPMSVEQALARRQEMMNDADFKSKLGLGPTPRKDPKALKEFEAINRVITGVTEAWR